MDFAVGALFGLLTAALAVITIVLFNFHNSELTIHKELHKMAIAVSDLLTQITAISTDVDALVAASVPQPPVDLQPVSDALTALDAKVKAATPVPPTSP